MKVPYLVNWNTLQSYATPATMSGSPAEASRKIRAEDFSWDTDFTPQPLTFYAAVVLSRMFDRLNPLQIILQKDVDILMDLYPANIQLKFSVPYIKVSFIYNSLLISSIACYCDFVHADVDYSCT